jgi:sugar phosphate isomerase/epimerase
VAVAEALPHIQRLLHDAVDDVRVAWEPLPAVTDPFAAMASGAPRVHDDADKNVVGTLFEDTIYKRKLCGEGFFNPPEFIKAVQSAGFKGAYGVEILSETYRKLPLKEMARRSFDTTMQQFKKIAA